MTWQEAIKVSLQHKAWRVGEGDVRMVRMPNGDCLAELKPGSRKYRYMRPGEGEGWDDWEPVGGRVVIAS